VVFVPTADCVDLGELAQEVNPFRHSKRQTDAMLAMLRVQTAILTEKQENAVMPPDLFRADLSCTPF
jgi:hypothetical protein